jgi:hypothetical protein
MWNKLGKICFGKFLHNIKLQIQTSGSSPSSHLFSALLIDPLMQVDFWHISSLRTTSGDTALITVVHESDMRYQELSSWTVISKTDIEFCGYYIKYNDRSMLINRMSRLVWAKPSWRDPSHDWFIESLFLSNCYHFTNKWVDINYKTRGWYHHIKQYEMQTYQHK